MLCPACCNVLAILPIIKSVVELNGKKVREAVMWTASARYTVRAYLL